VRAVHSIPLVSSGGALVGMLSNHFATVGRPTDLQLCGWKDAAKAAANAIVRVRAENGDLFLSSLDLIEQSYRAIDLADRLLARAPDGQSRLCTAGSSTRNTFSRPGSQN
jgi:hypothetical protein